MAKFSDAVALFKLGQFAEAEKLCALVLASTPQHFDALHLSGVLALHAKSYQRAADFIGRALALTPDNAPAHNNHGMAFMGVGDFAQALESFETAAALKPGFAAALGNRGNALRSLGRAAEAVASYDAAIALKPDYAQAFNGGGLALKDLDRPDESLAWYDKAIAADPGLAEAWDNRGVVLQDLKRFESALASHDAALGLAPDVAQTWSNRGVALDYLRRYEEALESYDRALALDARMTEAWSNRGVTLGELGRRDEALKSFEQAVIHDSGNADAQWNLSLSYLQMGKLAEGWAKHEWRWKIPRLKLVARGFTQPVWMGGASIVGQTILLHGDHGLGDSIQFCRYAKLVSDLGARVILEVRRPLVELMRSVAGVSDVVATGDALPAFDTHCPLSSLPGAFATTLETIPSPAGYLHAADDKVATWRQRIGERTKPRVGLAWRGNPAHQNDHNRSIAFSDILAFLPEGLEVVALQKDITEAEHALAMRHNIRSFASQLTDFSETAALCTLMDVVVSVDTSVAHLAGGLGQRVMVLLAFNPDWRWLLERSDSPWYTTVKLYRQDKPSGWTAVFEKLRADLALLAAF